MTIMKDNVLSLRSHLMERLLTALFLLWLASSIVGYFATLNYANQPYDLILLERAHMAAERMRLGSGAVEGAYSFSSGREVVNSR